jgi:hypothetical protein
MNSWCTVSMYVGYPESKFRWATEKKTRIYFLTIYIAICTHLTLLFDSFHHCWDTCSGAPVFGSLHRRMMPPVMQTRVNDFIDLVVTWNRRPPRKVSRCRNTWKSLGAKSGLQGGWSNCSQPNVTIRSCIAAGVCERALSWSITKPRLSMPRRLFHFMFIRKHLQHPGWKQFPKTMFIRHNFMKKLPWNLWKM